MNYTMRLEKDMQECIDAFKQSILRLRLGKPVPELVSNIKVKTSYDEMSKIGYIASIETRKQFVLLIKPYNINDVKAIKDSILIAQINANLNVSVNKIELVFPIVTQETRIKMAYVLKDIQEEFLIQLRGLRRDLIKKMRKNSNITHVPENKIHEIFLKYKDSLLTISQNKEARILDF